MLPVNGGAFVLPVPEYELDIIVYFLCAYVARQIHGLAYQSFNRVERS